MFSTTALSLLCYPWWASLAPLSWDPSVGKLTISLSAPGYVTSTHQLYVPPFSTSWVNLSLNTTVTKVYRVVFNENGLPSGTTWSVILNGTTRPSTGNISFTILNGTYSYSIGSVPGYSILSVLGYNESSGYLTVDGYDLSHPVTFVKVISKGFLTGSIYPLNASIWINGTIYHAVNGQFNISLSPGTYEIKVSDPGYSTYTTNITVSSSSVSRLPIQSLTSVTTPSSFSFLLIIVIAVIIWQQLLLQSFYSQSETEKENPNILHPPPFLTSFHSIFL